MFNVKSIVMSKRSLLEPEKVDSDSCLWRKIWKSAGRWGGGGVRWPLDRGLGTEELLYTLHVTFGIQTLLELFCFLLGLSGVTCHWCNHVASKVIILRGFIKSQAPGKLTGCERDLAINLPGCFCLLFLLPFIRKTKNARLKNPTDLLKKWNPCILEIY